MMGLSRREGGQAKRPASPRMPGEPGIWVFIGGDAIVFSVLFVTMAVHSRADSLGFAAAQQDLGLAIGLINTLILLTGSLLVAGAVHTARTASDVGKTVLLTRGAALTGGLFLANKAYEWGHLFHQGLGVYSNEFMMFFFVLTGIHGIHVLLACTALLFQAGHMRNKGITANTVRGLVSVGLFWHLVDLLWIVLFAQLYLLS